MIEIEIYYVLSPLIILLLLYGFIRIRRKNTAQPRIKEQDNEPYQISVHEGLTKTREGFVSTLSELFSKQTPDDNVLNEIEETLLTADIGIQTVDKIFQHLKNNPTTNVDELWNHLKSISHRMVNLPSSCLQFEQHIPLILLIVGVNGVGKTTSIGKLASRFVAEGKKVLLVPGDTFRAAATEQLIIWAKRTHADIYLDDKIKDPSSLIFDAIKHGVSNNYDLILIDTAGRLHTKVTLMDELSKIKRVCNKALPSAPHETWLVIDGTTGQNAIAQAKYFKEATPLTGLIITKLDGTAKGGVVLGLCDQLNIPIRFIGIGEVASDLKPFVADEFIDALYLVS